MRSAVIETKTTVELWTADPSRTTVEFEVEHLWGLDTVCGRFRSFDGAYIVGPGGSRIELTIDAGSVDTGCPARDNHLRSADFFGADEHPLVRFTSTRVTGMGKRTRARERRAGSGGQARASRIRRIGATGRRRPRARGDDHGRPEPIRHERRAVSQRGAADEAARGDAPRPQRQPFLTALDRNADKSCTPLRTRSR